MANLENKSITNRKSRFGYNKRTTITQSVNSDGELFTRSTVSIEKKSPLPSLISFILSFLIFLGVFKLLNFIPEDGESFDFSTISVSNVISELGDEFGNGLSIYNWVSSLELDVIPDSDNIIVEFIVWILNGILNGVESVIRIVGFIVGGLVNLVAILTKFLNFLVDL